VESIVEDFVVEPGMSIFEIIDPLLMIHAILPVSYADGKLTLTRAGTNIASDVLELGVNVKSGSINQSLKNRYSNYVVRGQGKATKNKDTRVYTGAEGTYSDPVVPRYRPLMIVPDHPVEGDQD
jgi:prophage tail gpP-like protein